MAQAAQHAGDVGLGVEVELGCVERLHGAAGEVGIGLADEVGQGRVGALDVAVAHESDAHTGEREHQVAVAAERLELGLLLAGAGDVGEHDDEFERLDRLADAPHRQGVPAGALAGQHDLDVGLVLAVLLHLAGGLGDGTLDARVGAQQHGQALPGQRARWQAQHALEATVAAHQHVVLEVGDAGGRAFKDGAEFVQQHGLVGQGVGIGVGCDADAGRVGHLSDRRFADGTQEAPRLLWVGVGDGPDLAEQADQARLASRLVHA